MEHQNSIICPRCRCDVLLVEEGGAYACTKCHTKFYRGVLKDDSTPAPTAKYISASHPQKGRIYLKHQED